MNNQLCANCHKPTDNFQPKFCSANCVRLFFKGKTKSQKLEFMMQDYKEEKIK